MSHLLSRTWGLPKSKQDAKSHHFVLMYAHQTFWWTFFIMAYPLDNCLLTCSAVCSVKEFYIPISRFTCSPPPWFPTSFPRDAQGQNTYSPLYTFRKVVMTTVSLCSSLLTDLLQRILQNGDWVVQLYWFRIAGAHLHSFWSHFPHRWTWKTFQW